jgi:pantetheine-phosphate adenylyltransferase
MTTKATRRVLFPGTFDPVTNGHRDVIQRSAALFGEVVVGVGSNPEKKCLLPAELRAEILSRVLAELPNVRVEIFAGLTVDFARRLQADAIVRGLRNSADLHQEFQMALTNRTVADIETIFIMTSPEHAFISSSLIRQIARNGGDISAMVPAEAVEPIRRACGP